MSITTEVAKVKAMQIVGSNRYRWPLHDDVIAFEYEDILSRTRKRDQKTRALQDRCLNVQAAGTRVTHGGSVALCCVKLCYSFNKNNLNISASSRVYQLKIISNQIKSSLFRHRISLKIESGVFTITKINKLIN